ncbi:PREDICTED: mothers against decapentaplegic homolog 4-like isoform X2 [Amphimedon queenslandica]|uniref:Mothers against decapentaplegic homolog n=1 Tax=Amphimedon queenslandica TaxID=400682 RepID=A0AAN0K314_AMPQE|nr:PREDICTED: mothers against decapentaplegic homolog 4-like isoform X2 [Amphimedon queenslandica]|eukprot:XP_019863679.1 PREDICTED: mothers against decapentaplegic homolog 4-like isoform X2 [Amphimedon queenslandica]
MDLLPALEPCPSIDFEDLYAAQPGASGAPRSVESSDLEEETSAETCTSIVHSQSPSSSGLGGETFINIFTTIVHSLMCHIQGSLETNEFAQRAIESLVLKIKDKSDELESLVTAITTGGTKPSICVTIPRTLDGRLQVSGRKGYPHVMYAKIWRWPDLHKDELRCIELCQYAFDLNRESVCVNPYHYERVVSQGPSSCDIVGSNVVHHKPPPPLLLHVNQEAMEESPGVGGYFNTQGMMAAAASQQQEYMEIQPSCVQALSGWGLPGASPYNAMTNQIDPALQMNQLLQYYNPGNYVPPVIRIPQAVAPPLAPPTINSVTTCTLSPLPHTTTPDFWCKILYHELAIPVGECFKVPANITSVSVDGFVDPSAVDRFCLGRLSNVHRTEPSKRVISHIEKGIVIEEKNETEVWIRCVSRHSVFVQSNYLDYQAGQAQGDAVHKIYPNAYIKVFDLSYCYEEMQKQARKACLAVANQTAAVRGDSLQTANIDPDLARSIGVDDLRRLCILRLSFVKGWGSDYKRQTIKETPCWIEVHFNRALQLLDSVLTQLPSEFKIQDSVKL